MKTITNGIAPFSPLDTPLLRSAGNLAFITIRSFIVIHGQIWAHFSPSLEVGLVSTKVTCNCRSIQRCQPVIQSSPTVKSLGVILDRQLRPTFDEHVASITKTCLFHICALRHVRNSLPDDVAKTVACSNIDCRLDYCNSLFVGMSVSNFKSLQRVQNTLAWMVLRRGKFEHITPALIDLHCVPK